MLKYTIKLLFVFCVLVMVGISGSYQNAFGAGVSTKGYKLQSKLIPTNLPSGFVGLYDIAVSGNTMVVGAPTNGSGAVFVFVRSGNDWVQQAKLVASDGTGNRFGHSVAIDGDTVVVGSFYTNSNQGAAFVYQRSGTTWTEQQKLTASDGAQNEWFGYSVAVSGNRVFIGAKYASNGGLSQAGAVYVFDRAGNSWTQGQKLSSTPNVAAGEFGTSLAVNGNTLVIGASGKTTGNSFFQGAVYVYTLTASSIDFQQKITPSDRYQHDRFGDKVAIEGDTIVVGATWRTFNPNYSLVGAVYVYQRSGVSWTEQTRLTRTDESVVVTQFFGENVRIKQGKILVGSGSSSSGKSIYAFEKTDGVNWQQTQKITSPSISSGLTTGFTSIDDTIFISTADSLYRYDSINLGRRFDFDGDNQSDISVFRPSAGAWYFHNSSGGYSGIQWGTSTDRPVPADYDGDRKTDVAVFRDGYWYILNSSDNSFRAYPFGTTGDFPVPGDYDGDGKADFMVYRANSIFRINSFDSSYVGNTYATLGDKPVMADFDGDYRLDLAKFKSSDKSFNWYESSNNISASGNFRTKIVGAGDVPIPADFDGDGATDFATFDSSNGTWTIMYKNGSPTLTLQFGFGTDIPVPADYDGDGKADIAVYRPSTGGWYRLNSSNGSFYGELFGAADDKPLPAVFR